MAERVPHPRELARPFTVGVLALQGDYARHAAALAAAGEAVRLVDDAASLAACDALVMPGGESTTMLRLLAATGTISGAGCC